MMDRRSWIKKSSAAAVAATATATATAATAAAAEIGITSLNLTGLGQDPEITRLLFNENPYGPLSKGN